MYIEFYIDRGQYQDGGSEKSRVQPHSCDSFLYFHFLKEGDGYSIHLFDLCWAGDAGNGYAESVGDW